MATTKDDKILKQLNNQLPSIIKQIENKLKQSTGTSSVATPSRIARLSQTISEIPGSIKGKIPGLSSMPGLPSMPDSISNMLSGLNSLFPTASTEDRKRIIEINRIVYHSLLHPNRKDIENIDLIITKKGFTLEDDLDNIDTQFAQMVLDAKGKTIDKSRIKRNTQKIYYNQKKPTIGGKRKRATKNITNKTKRI